MLCSYCRDWTAIGLVVSEVGCRWIETDSKHIDPFWGDVGRYDLFIGVYEARPGDVTWSLLTPTVGDVIDFYKQQHDPDWVKEYQLVTTVDLSTPFTISDIEVLNKMYEFKLVSDCSS